MTIITRPSAEEHAVYFQQYLDAVEGDDLIAVLSSHLAEALSFYGGISELQSMHRYEPQKWSIKEVIAHVTDTERIFMYRALRFSRKDALNLEGFDENIYAPNANADARNWRHHIREFEAVRSATILFFEGITEEMSRLRGSANGHEVSVRALGYMMAGHELHHRRVISQLYL